MAKGKVKWFNNAKGYGFILPEAGDGDLFAHYSSIQMEGYKTLKAGQEVEFDILEGPKGQHAINIRHATYDGDAGNVAPEQPVPPPEQEQPVPPPEQEQPEPPPEQEQPEPPPEQDA